MKDPLEIFQERHGPDTGNGRTTMSLTIREIRGETDEGLLARIRDLAAREDDGGLDNWEDSQELALLRAEAAKRGLAHA